jgi:hypothetical protein
MVNEEKPLEEDSSLFFTVGNGEKEEISILGSPRSVPHRQTSLAAEDISASVPKRTIWLKEK